MKLKYCVAVLFTVINFTATAQKKNIKIETLKVYGTCSQCKTRIEAAVKSIGAYKANWSIETKTLTVSYDSAKLSTTSISKKLADVGHDTELFQAKESTYKSLPKCCYYQRYVPPTTPIFIIDSINKIELSKAASSSTITGIILEEDKKGNLKPLINATVTCINTYHVAITDGAGLFQLNCTIPIKVAVSYVGFKVDTVNITSQNKIKIILKNASSSNLNEVVVNSKMPSTYISSINTFNTLNISSKELTKAACCNLSESFETSPSVDVSYADAVTGIKQIQLLGLASNYTQITTENTPEIKGLAGSYGLTFIAGSWIDGIQLTKGVGSVANGYESIAGQINVEEKKPDKMEKIFINAYANNLCRFETNIDFLKPINNNWSTALLTHIDGVVTKTDNNNDGFLDIPIGKQINIINRWRYANTNGVFAQFAIKAVNDNRQAGQINFNPATDKFTTNNYGVGINVEQYIFTGKLGYVFPQQKYKSIGFIFSANSYNNSSYYGLTKYQGKQNAIFANLIYQSIIGTSAHKFRTGLSFASDNYNETHNTTNFKRIEIVLGSFFEYTYTPTTKLTAVAGLRLDYHNKYGLITTPRFHLKYNFNTTTNIRFSVGSGFRIANIFAENTGLFASSRQYSILNSSLNYAYGLNPEKAWNYGLNFVKNFKLNSHLGSFSFDTYHTDFTKQVVVDVDANPQKILFYNLHGKSFSNSVQAEINYELIKKLDVRLVYRWLDVQTNYNGTMMQKPLIAKHRAFINLSSETKKKWKFDFTAQWFSKKRLPKTSSNPINEQMNLYSPSFIQMAAQVTKQFGSKWDIYFGAENLTNYTQQNLIIAASQPFSQYFDASIIWGPVNGRVLYLGARFKIK